MIFFRLEEMKGGWFVGDFSPVAVRCSEAEVACKLYPAGASEDRHVHKVATEITLIARGRAVMNGRVVSSGDIVVIPPGESTDFNVLEETLTLVVKLPSVRGDKYPAG